MGSLNKYGVCINCTIAVISTSLLGDVFLKVVFLMICYSWVSASRITLEWLRLRLRLTQTAVITIWYTIIFTTHEWLSHRHSVAQYAESTLWFTIFQ